MKTTTAADELQQVRAALRELPRIEMVTFGEIADDEENPEAGVEKAEVAEVVVSPRAAGEDVEPFVLRHRVMLVYARTELDPKQLNVLILDESYTDTAGSLIVKALPVKASLMDRLCALASKSRNDIVDLFLTTTDEGLATGLRTGGGMKLPIIPSPLRTTDEEPLVTCIITRESTVRFVRLLVPEEMEESGEEGGEA